MRFSFAFCVGQVGSDVPVEEDYYIRRLSYQYGDNTYKLGRTDYTKKLVVVALFKLKCLIDCRETMRIGVRSGTVTVVME